MKKGPGDVKRFGVIGLVSSVVLFLVIATPWPTLAGDTIKIGRVEALSGFMKLWGDQCKEAWSIMLEEVNAKGGILGKKVEVVFEDHEYRPDVAVRKAKKLILEDKVDMLGTTIGSHVAIALNRVAGNYKKLYFNFGGQTDDIQGKHFTPYSFRMTSNVYASCHAIAYAASLKPFRKFYLVAPDYTFGHDWGAGVKAAIKKFMPDAQIVGEDYHPMPCKDFAPYVTKIIASGADAIFSGNFSTDAVLFCKAVREMGLKAPFPIFSFASVFGPVAQELKDEAVGIYQNGYYDFVIDTPGNQAFVKKWHERNKDKSWEFWYPVDSAPMEYVGWPMVFAALEKAGSLDSEKVITALEGFEYDTIIGRWTMRACDHQILQPNWVKTFMPGKSRYYDWNWYTKDVLIEIPAEKLANPATPDYNPRCK